MTAFANALFAQRRSAPSSGRLRVVDPISGASFGAPRKVLGFGSPRARRAFSLFSGPEHFGLGRTLGGYSPVGELSSGGPSVGTERPLSEKELGQLLPAGSVTTTKYQVNPWTNRLAYDVVVSDYIDISALKVESNRSIRKAYAELGSSGTGLGGSALDVLASKQIQALAQIQKAQGDNANRVRTIERGGALDENGFPQAPSPYVYDFPVSGGGDLFAPASSTLLSQSSFSRLGF